MFSVVDENWNLNWITVFLVQFVPLCFYLTFLHALQPEEKDSSSKKNLSAHIMTEELDGESNRGTTKPHPTANTLDITKIKDSRQIELTNNTNL